MPEDIREKVRRLLELATHPTTNETEARNASMAVCRLIKEHRLLEPRAPRPRPAVTVDSIHFSMDEIFGQVHRRQSRVSPTRPPPQHTVEGAQPRMPKDPTARTFVLGSPAICAGCNDQIRISTMVIVSHRSVWHPACYHAATD
jgi:Protein of unknown function (DUF2786)